MYECMYVWMYVCIYVYLYVYVMSYVKTVGVSEVYEGAISKQLSKVYM
jgi:hypothetical protein